MRWYLVLIGGVACAPTAERFVEDRYWLACEMEHCLPGACEAADVPSADGCALDVDLAEACVGAAQAYLDAGLCGARSQGMPAVCAQACGE